MLEIQSELFDLAELWGLRREGGNPCRSVHKYKGRKRERGLSDEEFRALGAVLNVMDAEGSADAAAIRLLMLTGYRLLTRTRSGCRMERRAHVWYRCREQRRRSCRDCPVTGIARGSLRAARGGEGWPNFSLPGSGCASEPVWKHVGQRYPT